MTFFALRRLAPPRRFLTVFRSVIRRASSLKKPQESVKSEQILRIRSLARSGSRGQKLWKRLWKMQVAETSFYRGSYAFRGVPTPPGHLKSFNIN